MIPRLYIVYTHTYTHNWSLQPFSQDYVLASHTTYVMCVNFIHKRRDLQFKVDSERQIFEKLFHVNFINPQSFCQKSAERKSPKKYFHIFVLMSDLGFELGSYVYLANTLSTRLWRLPRELLSEIYWEEIDERKKILYFVSLETSGVYVR